MIFSKCYSLFLFFSFIHQVIFHSLFGFWKNKTFCKKKFDKFNFFFLHI